MPEDPRILTRERFTAGLHSLMDANNPAPESTLLSIDDHDDAQRKRIATLEADSRRLREALEKITQISFAAENGQAVAWEIARAALQPSPVQSGADCKTCGGTKRVMRVVKQYEDAYVEHSQMKFSDCPDCTAAPQLSGESECPDSPNGNHCSKQDGEDHADCSECCFCGMKCCEMCGRSGCNRGCFARGGAEPTTEKQG